MADGLAGGGGLGRGAVAARERGFSLEALGVTDQQLWLLRSARLRTRQGGWRRGADELGELVLVGVGLSGEFLGAAGKVAQHREDEPLALGCVGASAHLDQARGELSAVARTDPFAQRDRRGGVQ